MAHQLKAARRRSGLRFQAYRYRLKTDVDVQLKRDMLELHFQMLAYVKMMTEEPWIRYLAV